MDLVKTIKSDLAKAVPVIEATKEPVEAVTAFTGHANLVPIEEAAYDALAVLGKLAENQCT